MNRYAVASCDSKLHIPMGFIGRVDGGYEDGQRKSRAGGVRWCDAVLLPSADKRRWRAGRSAAGHAMIYLIAFAAFVAVALFWRTFARVARALSLAVLGGIAIGSAAGGVEVGVLAGAALLVLILTMTRAPRLTASALPAMSAVRSADEAPTVASDPVDVRAARDENRATWFGFARRSRPAPRDDAWTLWTRAAPESAARIAVARRSCERLAERLRARPMDPNALDRLVLIDRTVPALIESDLEEAEKAAGVGERQLILTGLAEAIEEFAADCERQTAGEVSEAGIRSVVLRRRLRSGFAQDGF